MTTKNGRRKLKKTTRIRKTYAEATAALAELRAMAPSLAAAGDGTLAEFLAKWLVQVGSDRAKNTVEHYRLAVDRWIVPTAGRVPLGQVRARHVEQVLAEIPETKSRTRKAVFTVLRLAFRAAMHAGLLTASPCDQVQAPRHTQRRPEPFTRAERAKILEAVKGDRLEAFFRLAFDCGLRFGELAGLKWGDIEAGQISIRRQVTHCRGKMVEGPPKSARSIRTVRLPADVAASLESRREIAAAEGFDSEYVFLSPAGCWLSGSNFRTNTWIPLLERLEIPYRQFHATRHTFATSALAAGVQVHVVSGILGHSQPSVTHDIYAHLIDGHQQSAIDQMARFYGNETGSNTD